MSMVFALIVKWVVARRASREKRQQQDAGENNEGSCISRSLVEWIGQYVEAFMSLWTWSLHLKEASLV